MTVTYLRHSMRHVQQTMIDDITAGLDDLGWRTDGSVPFGADPLVIRTEPLAAEERETIQGNTVVISFGDSPDDVDEELGGGITLTETVVFVDAICTSDAIAIAVAEDVADRMKGRAPGTSRYRELNDYTSSQMGTPVDGWQLELTGVSRERPLSGAFRHWQVVKATVEIRFPGDET